MCIFYLYYMISFFGFTMCPINRLKALFLDARDVPCGMCERNKQFQQARQLRLYRSK